jgi:hypothetical protein
MQGRFSRQIRSCQKVEEISCKWASFGYFHPLWANAPGLERPNIRLRVKAGGHNNTQLNPVFRGMVRRLVGAGSQQKEIK